MKVTCWLSEEVSVSILSTSWNVQEREQYLHFEVLVLGATHMGICQMRAVRSNEMTKMLSRIQASLLIVFYIYNKTFQQHSRLMSKFFG